MKLLVLNLFLLACGGVFAQAVTFKETDQKLKVYRGDKVDIVADTAFIISKDRAYLLNEKLNELEATRALNSEIFEKHKELKTKVLEIEKLVSDLLKKINAEEDAIKLDFTEILNQLDASLVTLRQNNNELAQHNSDLKTQIRTLQTTIKTLKKEIRGIWWNGVLDKIIVGVASLAIGFILGSI